MTNKGDIAGTDHFPSIENAMAYYRPYGEDRDGVKNKIKEGLITIGRPPQKSDCILFIRDHRWHYQKQI